MSVDNLPRWIDQDALDEFIAMRNKIKKPLTARAMVRLVGRLQALKDAGHDPNASLVQSADHYWQDCYAPKDMAIEPKHAHKAIDATQGYLAGLEAAKATMSAPPARVLAMVSRRKA